MRRLAGFSLALVALAVVGCPSPEGALDADGDGSPADLDCDDLDPWRFPNPGGYGEGVEITRVDIPYNHVDDDCGGADGDLRDLVDVDGDGYAGVSFEVYAAEHMALYGLTSVDEVPWAASDRERLDCVDVDGPVPLPNGAIAAEVNPDAADAPYDGVDQDCGGDNDFDADGDGWFPAQYTSQFADFVLAFHPATAPDGPASWAAPGGVRAEPGDCLDQPHPGLPALSPDTVHPGAVDAAYDGVDANCDGGNDYDADGDGFVADEHLVAFGEYVALWSGGAPGFPNTVAPSTAVGGDCDDTDAAVLPDHLELLFDAADADCDGLPDATPFGFAGYAWHDPRGPRVVRTEAHYLVGATATWADIGVTQKQHPALALVFAPDSGHRAPVLDPLEWENLGLGVAFEHGAVMDMVARGDRFWVSSSYVPPAPAGNEMRRLLVREYTAAGGSYEGQAASRVFPWTGHDAGLDLQVRQDASGQDVVWATACGGAQRTAPDFEPVPGAQASFSSFALDAPIQSNFALQTTRLQFQAPATSTGAACFQEISPDGGAAILTTCDELGCESYDATLGASPAQGTWTPSASGAWNDVGVREANVNGDLLVVVKSAGGIVVKDLVTGEAFDLLTGQDVISADAGRRAGRLFVAAIVDEGGPTRAVKVFHTDAPGVTAPSEILLPLSDDDVRYEHAPAGGCDVTVLGCATGRNLNPTKIGMFVDDDADPTDDRLVVAVSARSLDEPTAPVDALGVPTPQDAVGWVFLGFATP